MPSLRLPSASARSFGVPVCFERVCHQAVIGIDPQVPALAEINFIAGPLDPGSTKAVSLDRSGRELGPPHRGPRREASGLTVSNEQFADRPVDPGADDPRAERLRRGSIPSR